MPRQGRLRLSEFSDREVADADKSGHPYSPILFASLTQNKQIRKHFTHLQPVLLFEDSRLVLVHRIALTRAHLIWCVFVPGANNLQSLCLHTA
jgi:hypothetical protein